MRRSAFGVLASLALVPMLAALGCDGSKVDSRLVLVEAEKRDLKILSSTPAAGPLAGGTIVVLTGEGFRSDMTVKFGELAGTQVAVGGDELAVVTTPAATASGAVDIVVTRAAEDDTAAQTQTVSGGFFYEPLDAALAVFEVVPDTGLAVGGYEVTVLGTGFTTGANVYFGTAVATATRVIDSRTIVAQVPPSATIGKVDVRVANPDASDKTLADGFEFKPNDEATKVAVLGVRPGHGPLAGGNFITIEGRGFVAGATVKLGGIAATDVDVLGPEAIIATAPAGNGPGPVDVRVDVPAQGDLPPTGILEEGYRYDSDEVAALSVLAIIPAEGPLTGGNQVAIQGTGFSADVRVFLGGQACTDVRVLGSEGLTCTAPSNTVAGLVTVRVEHADGDGEGASLPDAYRYQAGPPALLVLRALPATGPLEGGNIVTLEGSGFRAGAVVRFGGVPGTQVNVLADTALVVTAPAAAASGPVTIRVELPQLAGQPAADAYDLANAYTYQLGTVVVGDLGVASLYPPTDKVDGGALALITGNGFDPAMVVRFGNVQSPLVQVLSTRAANVVIPPGVAGVVDVTITNPSGAHVTLTDGFRYLDKDVVDTSIPPALGGVVPSQGPTTGGSLVRVLGQNFAPDLKVYFGGTAATRVTVISPSLAVVETPAGTAGTAAVKITNGQPGATLEDVLQNGWTYKAAGTLPTIASVWPTMGPVTGGTWVILNGTNLGNGAQVFFGMTPAAAVYSVDATRVIALTAAAEAGTVDVGVTLASGDFVKQPSAFAFYPVDPLPADPPVLGAVVPALGDVAGGQTVQLIGSAFASGSRIFFGDKEATVMTSTGTSSWTIKTPAHSSGSVDVTIVSPQGLTHRKSDLFTYIAAPPLIRQVAPASGSTSGGYEVAIEGKNFGNAGLTVRFGAVNVQTFTQLTPERIAFLAPPAAQGVIDVVVVNPDSQSDVAHAAFAYVTPGEVPVPVITSIEPAHGASIGGYIALVRGHDFQPGATVKVGGGSATSVEWIDATLIKVIVPAGTAGAAVDVSVSNGPNINGSLPGGFTYDAAQLASLSIVSVAPGAGATSGGTVLTIDGAGFLPGTTVQVGGAAAQTVNVISSSTITAVTPSGARGLVSVRVVRPDNIAVTAFNAFAYLAPTDFALAPRINDAAPAVGPLTGGSLVMLTGERFAADAIVYFGADRAPEVDYVDGKTLVVRTPARATSGTVAVSVTNPDGSVGVLPGGFSYYDATNATRPEVFITQPATGSTFGLETVAIIGDNLQPGARAYFCNRPATTLGLTGDATLSVLTPAAAPGVCKVSVVNPDGLTADRDEAFEFVSPIPTVTSILPSSGPKAGGIDVVVRGTGFVTGATVRFGLAQSSSVTVADQTTLTARLPAAAVGVVDVSVINPGGGQATGTKTNAFTYVDTVDELAPIVTSVFPSAGPLTGGTPVRIVGDRFDPTSVVIFDGQILGAATVVSPQEIRFNTPPRASAGTVPLTVLSPNGLGATVAEAFTYTPPTLPAPAIQSVVPATGPQAGNKTITIVGQNFRATGRWQLGGIPLATASTITESLVTATAPPHAPGKVDLIYVGPDGQVAQAINAFEYIAAPTVASVVPGLGGTAGDTQVTVVGQNFQTGLRVFFGPTAGTVLSVAPTTATVRTPSSVVAGFVNVVARNSDGQEGTLVDGFEYLAKPVVASVWPPQGPVAGGTLLALTGTGFHGQSRVFFGATEATQVYFANSTSLLALVPAGTAGVASDIVVQNPDGEQFTLATAFTYRLPAQLNPSPTLTAMFPANGPLNGGTRIGLDGLNLRDQGRAYVLPLRATIESVRSDRAVLVAPAGTVGPAQVWWVDPDGWSIRAPSDFTYLGTVGASPTVTAVTPTVGPTAGNTVVTIGGTNFQANSRVRFGGDDATTVSQTPTQLVVRTPAQGRGTVPIWVVNPDGTQVIATPTYLYLAPPTMQSVTPNKGPASGNTTVTITGRDFLEDPAGAKPAVVFCASFPDGTDCTSADPTTVQVSADAKTITAKSPVHTPGLVDVAVVAPDNQSAALIDSFTYSQLPTIATVAPDAGPTAGGQTIILTGTGYQSGLSVLVGGKTCNEVNLGSATQVSCKTPSGVVGAADIKVTNPDGGTVTKTGAYTYVAPPVLANLVPNLAPEGTQVETTLQGQNFSPQATIIFGVTVVPPTDVLSRTSTTIRVLVPMLSGSVDVIVRNPDGQESRLIDGFSFIPPLAAPSALYITPRTGLSTGGELFRIAGASFLDGVIVEFGKAPDWVAAPADSIVVKNNGTLITGLTAPHATGIVDVRITNSDGQSSILADAFEFVPPPDAIPLGVLTITPSRSPKAGGGYMTITGTGFAVNVQVTFKMDTFSASSTVQRFGPTLMRALIPPSPTGAAGKVDLIVTNPPTFEHPTPETFVVSNFFEYINGPLFQRDPGDRLPNEPNGDYGGALVFDANGDGNNDVLVFNSTRDRLLINGWDGRTGWFGEGAQFSQSNFGTEDAFAADYDGDGDLDVMRHAGSQLQLCINTGGGNFPTCTTVVSAPCGFSRPAVGDLNCDGRDDFYLPMSCTNRKDMIVLNAGNGTFIQTEAALPDDREDTRKATIEDVDGDGDNDVLLAQGTSTINRLYFNNCADLQQAGTCQMSGLDTTATASNAGHSYALGTTAYTQSNASGYCRAFGYDGLVRVDSAAEQTFLEGVTAFQQASQYWTGLRDDDHDHVFDWDTGGSSSSVDWCSGYPTQNAGYDCAYWQWSGTVANSCYRDYPCSSASFRPLCESSKPACASPWTFANAAYGTTFPNSSGDTRDAKFVDINDDGLPDALLSFYGQSTRVYMNTGGSAQGGQLFLESFERWPIETARDLDELVPVDIDDDGDIDIMARKGSQEIRLYINDRYTVTYKQFGCSTGNCACNPCAGDACERVVTNGTGSFHNATAAEWPDGNGTSWRTNLTTDTSRRSWAVGDLDGDDRPDVYAVGTSQSDRMIMNCGYEEGLPWANQNRVGVGDFRFNTFRSLPESNLDARVGIMADFNGDGAEDIFRCGNNMSFELWLNDGSGKWYDASDAALPDLWYSCYNHSAQAVDLDGDGDLDIHIEGTYPGTCPQGVDCYGRAQLVNDGFGNFIDRANPNITATENQYAQGVVFADFDHDGDQDWYVANDYYYGQTSFFINGGNAFNVGGAYGIDKTQAWITSTMNQQLQSTSAVVIDINHDSFPDLYVGRSGVNKAWLNVNGDHFVEAQSNDVPPGPFIHESGYSTNWLLAADFDKDGDVDIIDLVSGRNRYHLRDGAKGYFDRTVDFMPDISATSYGGDIGDVDNDGLQDVFIATAQQDILLLNTGTGFSDFSQLLPAASNQVGYTAYLRDFDGDCDLDVFVMNSNDQNRIYINSLNPPNCQH